MAVFSEINSYIFIYLFIQDVQINSFLVNLKEVKGILNKES